MISPQIAENRIVHVSNLMIPLYMVYWIIIFLVIAILFSFPFIYFDITVKSAGIIRPANERTEVKPIQTGIIDTIFYKEGDLILKDSVILLLKHNHLLPKKIVNIYELKQTAQFIHDLQIVTAGFDFLPSILNRLQSPLYKQQVSRFIYQIAEQKSTMKKITREIDINTILIKDKIIAPKEHFDKQVENEKLKAAYNAFKNEQISVWQQQLTEYYLKYTQLEMQQMQVAEEENRYALKAPVTGIIFGINSRYQGGVIQAGESFCIISPESDLMAECYVPTRHAGLLKINQPVKFQVDAFDYNFFGMLTGKILSIDNDFTLIENRPVFKVRCLFDHKQLYLKNGFKGVLKKGLTIQARFIVARRSAWQLLFDKLDDWLNPASPVNN